LLLKSIDNSLNHINAILNNLNEFNDIVDGNRNSMIALFFDDMHTNILSKYFGIVNRVISVNYGNTGQGTVYYNYLISNFINYQVLLLESYQAPNLLLNITLPNIKNMVKQLIESILDFKDFINSQEK
jgi:hypothetical protein